MYDEYCNDAAALCHPDLEQMTAVLCSGKAAAQATFELRICADNSSIEPSLNRYRYTYNTSGHFADRMRMLPLLGRWDSSFPAWAETFSGGDHSERQKIWHPPGRFSLNSIPSTRSPRLSKVLGFQFAHSGRCFIFTRKIKAEDFPLDLSVPTMMRMDFRIGSSLSFGDPTNGWRDPTFSLASRFRHSLHK